MRGVRGLPLGFSVFAALLWMQSTAAAKLCGDDVNGKDVPCACGDVVVSNVVIGDDPVARDKCSGDGLIVRALEAHEALTIDLAGATLQGDGEGVGILCLYGGAGGAQIISSGAPATIEHFRDGIAAHGSDAMSRLSNVTITRSARDGVRVHSENYRIDHVDVRASGRDGFGLMGGNFRIADTTAAMNARHGYFVMGRSGLVGFAGHGVSARGNGSAGFMVGGDSHQIIDCVASTNNKEGMHIQGDGHHVIGCQADENLSDGIAGMGNRWRVGGNQASNNGGNGIDVRGPNVTDMGRNSGSGNGSLVVEPQTPAQCQINAGPCRE